MLFNILLWLFAVACLAVVAWTLGESCRRAKSGELEKEFDK